SQSGADFWFKSLEGVDLAPGESRDITTYLLGIPVITTLTNEGGVAEVQIGSNLPEELVTDALAIQKLFNSPRDFPTSLEIYKRMVIEQQIRRHLLQAENNAAAPEQVVAVPEIPPATPTPEGMTSEEFQAHRMLAFINGRFEHFTDAVVTMPNFYPDGYDQILFFQTSDGGTIELKRTYRRESDENPTDFYINVYGPDVQDFHPALRAYTGYTVSDFVQTPPAGGFANPEWPDGDFDQRFDETLQFAQDIISESPMAADEAASLIQYRTTVMRSMSAFMNRFNGGSSAEFRQARVNYAARRTAAINGAEGTVPVLEPVEQDLNVARIPLAEVIVDDLPLAGIDDVGVKAQIAQLLEAHQASAESAHLLSWNGGMVPRGAVVNGQEIAGMQNGQVVATDGSMIGTYARVVTPKGDSLRNEVLVFITRNPS
ncbi:MAG TPA: hypothetical protein VLG47_08210, partial [Candidatus Saccharimonadales bacterium]|nr:hypothetical protein [Candidatus Saccharimonadales bacterium]